MQQQQQPQPVQQQQQPQQIAPDFHTLRNQVLARGFALPKVPSSQFILALTKNPPQKTGIRSAYLSELDKRLLNSTLLNSQQIHAGMMKSSWLCHLVQSETTAGSAEYAARVLNLATKRQMESTYAQLQTTMDTLKQKVRAEHPDTECNALANAFQEAGGAQMNQFLLHNQEAFNAAHPRIAKRNKGKLPAGHKSSKFSKEQTINKLLSDSNLTDDDIMKDVRRAFGSAKSVQLSWKTGAAVHCPATGTFTIELTVHAVIIDHAVDDVTSIPYIAKLDAVNVEKLVTKVVTNKIVARVSFDLQLTNIACGECDEYAQPAAITVDRHVGDPQVTTRKDVNYDFLARAMQFRASNFPGFGEGFVQGVNADGVVGLQDQPIISRFSKPVDRVVAGYNFDRSAQFYCPCCFRLLPMSVVQIWSGCGHLCCEGCIEQWIVTTLGSNCITCREFSALARRADEFAEHTRDIAHDWEIGKSGSGGSDNLMEEQKHEEVPAGRPAYQARPEPPLQPNLPDALESTKEMSRAQLQQMLKGVMKLTLNDPSERQSSSFAQAASDEPEADGFPEMYALLQQELQQQSADKLLEPVLVASNNEFNDFDSQQEQLLEGGQHEVDVSLEAEIPNELLDNPME